MAKENALQKRDGDVFLDQKVDSSDAPTLVEVTTYIREDQAVALEIIRNAERQMRGGDCDQAELFQEALDLLINARLIPIRLRANNE